MMECACIDNGKDGDGWAFEPTESWPSAKKNWKCGECRRVIPVGEKYYCHTGKWEGKFVVDRTCVDCRSVTLHLFCGYTFGQVWDELTSHLYDTGGEISWEKLAKLTPTARGMVCDLIERVWENGGR